MLRIKSHEAVRDVGPVLSESLPGEIRKRTTNPFGQRTDGDMIYASLLVREEHIMTFKLFTININKCLVLRFWDLGKIWERTQNTFDHRRGD